MNLEKFPVPDPAPDAKPKPITLADLSCGAAGTVVKILPQMRCRKKFADVGVVAGAELQMEAKAPFGGLLRVRIMESSMALHRDDAAHVVLEKGRC